MQGIVCKEVDTLISDSLVRKLVILEHGRHPLVQRKETQITLQTLHGSPCCKSQDSPTYPSISGCYAGLTSYILTK